MTRARHPLPTDIVALVSFDGKVYPNEAKPWDRLGLDDRAHPLETALEQWFSFATGKHTWVNVKGATIRGLVSARRRARISAWEVEALIDADEDKGVVLSLLNRMTAGVGRLGAEKVFLRLDADSPLVATARTAGFFPYLEETLYVRSRAGDVGVARAGLRRREQHDLLGVFQLYTRTVPSPVRAIEGATLREWQAAQETWGGRVTDLVMEDEGVIAAWLRLMRGQAGRCRILAGPPAEAVIENVLSAALSRLSGSQRVHTLVPSYAVGLARALESAGFEPVGRYRQLARRLVRPVAELAQEQPSTVIPVS